MFTVSDKPLDIEALSEGLVNHAAGAFVAFEGRVRKQNDGRAVDALEYELFPEMCEAEGQRIIEEAKALFSLVEVRAVHRYGQLALGESAVWVGVVTAHRGAAFQACRFIIDAIKSRCPIWKKESYVDGPSEWVGCPTCEHHAVSAPKVFSRQAKIVGAGGQKTLKNSHVLIVGMGGLGCPSALHLAAAGVGHLRLVDGDRLDPSNLHRQTLYGYQDIGGHKVQLAKRRLEELHPFTTIEAISENFQGSNAASLLSGIDLILDCTDNFSTKYLLNDQAVAQKIPYVQASIYQNQAQLFSYKPDETACLRCIRPIQPPADCVESCTDSGVLGAATSVVGSYQALEAVRILLGQKAQSLLNQIHFDLETMENFAVRRDADVSCPVCSQKGGLKDFVYDDETLYPGASNELDFESLRQIEDAIWIDIREKAEHGHEIKASKNWPLSTFPKTDLDQYADQTLVLFCQKGMRSRKLLQELEDRGLKNVRALKGGVEALSP